MCLSLALPDKLSRHQTSCCHAATALARAHNDAMRAAVVAAGDGSEPLLASRVPLHRVEGILLAGPDPAASCKRLCTARAHDLKLDDLAIKLHGADFLHKQSVNTMCNTAQGLRQFAAVDASQSLRQWWRCSFLCRCHPAGSRREESAHAAATNQERPSWCYCRAARALVPV